MSTLPEFPRRIWIRSFYGFMPEDDGYIGWTEVSARDRMLGQIADGDLFLIYGAASAETQKSHRNRVLGFLQIAATPIRDSDKASIAGMERKKVAGWRDRWTHAIPVVRAWRVDEPILLQLVAPKTYRPEAGQAIAVWNPPLLDEEVELALRIKVTEVSVFGETAIPPPTIQRSPLAQAFRPSRAFPASFGERVSVVEDGETRLYLTSFEGDGHALLGRRTSPHDKSVLVKIGVSSDPVRRMDELNAGFPPAAIGKWGKPLQSHPYPDHSAAEAAERIFKSIAEQELESLGGEFFRGDWIDAQLIFARIPGVARFGK